MFSIHDADQTAVLTDRARGRVRHQKPRLFRPGMNLQKWYADVVTGERVQILYLANLRMGPAVIGYSASYDSDSGAFQRAFHAGGVLLPEPAAGNVTWPCSDREIRWREAADREVLLHTRTDGARLTWNPVVLNGRPESSAGASGYVERLELEFLPWKLGLKELRWGRFCGGTTSIVWIQWTGSCPKSLALVDGRPCREIRIGDDFIEADGRCLLFGPRTTLVDEPLGDGALAGFPILRGCDAAAFFTGRERKWLAEASLHCGGDVVDHGNVVFEVVSWQ